MPEDRKTNVNNLTIVWQGQSWSVITPKGNVIFRSVDKREAFEFAKGNFEHVSVNQPAEDYLDKDFKEFASSLRKKKIPEHLSRQQEMKEDYTQKHLIETGQVSTQDDKKDQEVKDLQGQLSEVETVEVPEKYSFEFDEPDIQDDYLWSDVVNSESNWKEKLSQIPVKDMLYRINWIRVWQSIGVVVAVLLILILVSAVISFVASGGVANLLILLSVVGIVILAIVAFLKYMFSEGMLMGIFGVLLLMGSCGICGYFGLLPF